MILHGFRGSPMIPVLSLRSHAACGVRLARRPHSGHDVGREREVRIRVIVRRTGSRLQVSRRTELGSGNKRESSFTH